MAGAPSFAAMPITPSLWHRPETWVPLARLLHAALPPGRARARLLRDAYGVHGTPGVNAESVEDAVRDLEQRESRAGRTVTLTVLRTGTWTAVVAPRDDHDDAAVVLVPGAVPAAFRAPEPTAAPRASNDLDRIRLELHARVPDARGADRARLAALERVLGRPLPPELRVLFETSAGGMAVRVAGSRPAELAIALPDRSTVDWAQGAPGEGRGLGGPDYWRLGATTVPDVGPAGAVARRAVSPGWIPFAEDRVGHRYCLDLTPGPAGTVGQVVRLDLEGLAARLVADSLTDLVRGIATRRTAAWRSPPATAHVSSRDGRRPDQLAGTDGLQVLAVSGTAVDLGPCRRLPTLRALTAERGALADVRQLAAFPALEYLQLAPADWSALLDTGPLPRTLLAAGFTAGINAWDTVTAEMRAVAARIRAATRVPPPERTVLRGRL